MAVAGAAILVIVAALAAALLFRESIAQAVLRGMVTDFGVKDARLRVDRITTSSLAVSKFSAGTAMSFDRLTVGFSIGDLLQGRVARIDLTGLDMDMTQPGPWTGLQAKTGDETEPFVDLGLLPVVNIERARLRFPGHGGPMMATATATIRPGPDGNLALRARASISGPPGTMEMDYDGTFRIEADGNSTAVGRLRATSESLARNGAVIKSLIVELPLSVSANRTRVTAAVQKGARFDAKRLELENAFGTGPISGSFTGRLSSGASSGRPIDAEANIAISAEKVRGGDLSADIFTSVLALRLKTNPKGATIDITEGSRLAVDEVRTAKGFSATKLSTLLSGDVTLAWPETGIATDDGIAIEHNLSIVPEPITVPGATAIQANLGKIETNGTLAANGSYRGRLTMDTGRFTRADQSVTITGLVARLTTEAGLTAPGARLTVESLRDMSMKPISGAYDLAVTIQQTGKGLIYRANIGGLGIQRLVAVSGTHNVATGAGRADVSVPGVTLGSAGLAPESVIPALSTMRNATGRIGGDAKLIWGKQKIGGRATLRLDDLGGETDDAVIEGLSGTIVFDTLSPPSTAPDQLLRIKRIDAGAVLTDTSIRFVLQPSGTLRIDRAEAVLADGKIIVVAPSIDPVRQKANATVTFQGVQLEQLLKLADLGDLQASGRLHGFVPIRMADGKIAIDAGALASLGGGTLRFKSERAKQILKGGGDQVALMLQALEDFTYERLGIDIDKSLAGNAQVTLRTLGHNPAVLRGRKFQINVNLETNLDRLLDAALQWYHLSGRALRDIVAPGTGKGTR